MPNIRRNEPCSCGSGKKYKQCCLQTAATRVTSQDLVTNQYLEAALGHHQAGRLPQAEALYRQILQREPNHSDALQYLGVLAHQVGKLDVAVDLITRAISANPRNPTYYCNLGCVLQQQGKPSHAACALQQALSLKRDFPEAHYNLGLALQDQGRLEEAIASYQRALRIKPDYSEAYGNLGYALYQRGRVAEAIANYRKALSFRPHYPETHYNLGNALYREGRLDEAIASYVLALDCKPDYADALVNLGNALKALGKLDKAIASYQEAIRIRPEYTEAYINLSIALLEQGKFDEAIGTCRTVLGIAPDLPQAHYNLANALQGQDNLDEAVAAYQQAIRLKPDYAEAYGNLGRALQEQAKMQEAITAYERALALKADYASAFSNLIYLHAFARDIPCEEQCRLAAQWECAILREGERAAARYRKFVYVPRAGRKLRFGVVSAELGQHAVAEFLQPLLEKLDRSRFHLALYSTLERSGARAEQLKALADQFTSLALLSDSDAAEQIRSDGIDVLMDTTGHTSNCRLGIFAHRAAPVQCTYIGFWASTGLTEMDWCISDFSLPLRCDAHFRERLWRLPRFGNAYRGDASLPESKWNPSSDGTVWLGSFNKYSKIREETLALWAKVLHSVPKAKLLLEDRTAFDSQLHPRILAELERNGIASDRVEFWPYTPGWRSHMLLYDRLDIALDTVPFNSGTTAYDALWMGVPLVALEGDWSGGRMGSTVLQALGRPEWVARSEDDYAAIVAGLARDVELRKSIRKSQRARMEASPLCDGKGLANALQEAFEAMFDQWATDQEYEAR